MSLQPVGDARVWRHVRLMYILASLLFLVNVALGFMNVLDAPELARWQLLTHLHAGTIGWITFSIIATAVWVFTGEREVTGGYATRVGFLAWGGFVIFGGYVAAFALSFHFGEPYSVLLPVFGALAALTIVTAFVYTLVQMRAQPVVSTPHILISGALGIATIGATMGVILGVAKAFSDFVPPGNNPIGQHAGVMDSYLLLGLTGMLEAFIVGTWVRRTKGGITQTTLWVLTGLVAFVALFGDIGPLFPLSLLLLLAGLVTFLVRMARRTLGTNPLRGDTSVAVFWAGLWLPIYVVMFAALIVMFVREIEIPQWFFAMFAHTLFVGVATQVILVGMSTLARHRAAGREAITGGLWLINLGMLAFFIGKYARGWSAGAAVMGIGVLIALFASWGRMMGPGAPERTTR